MTDPSPRPTTLARRAAPCLLLPLLCVLLAGCAGDAAPEATDAAEPDDAPVVNALTPEEQEAGWELLLDGDPAEHWRGFRRDDLPSAWTMEDGALAFRPGGGEGGDIITREQYDDFELRLDWKIAENGNSGIFYHVREDYDAVWHSGPEMQVLDNEGHPDAQYPTHTAGANYDLHTPVRDVTRPPGEWNEARLVVDDGHVEHWLNGVKVVEFDVDTEDWRRRLAESKFADLPGYGQGGPGHIALQDHGDRVWYRNIRIRRLDE